MEIEGLAKKRLEKLLEMLEISYILIRKVVTLVYMCLCKNWSTFTIKMGVFCVIKFYLDNVYFKICTLGRVHRAGQGGGGCSEFGTHPCHTAVLVT